MEEIAWYEILNYRPTEWYEFEYVGTDQSAYARHHYFFSWMNQILVINYAN